MPTRAVPPRRRVFETVAWASSSCVAIDLRGHAWRRPRPGRQGRFYAEGRPDRPTDSAGMRCGARLEFFPLPHAATPGGAVTPTTGREAFMSTFRRLFACLALVAWYGPVHGATAANAALFNVTCDVYPTYSVFHDPDPSVHTKEFALFYNVVHQRGLFHLIYQRSGGAHSVERTFGHAWSTDLL